MSRPALDTVIGALLVETWANSFLYMAELIQVMYYFKHFKHDGWKLKTLVWVAFLLDTVSTLGDYAGVYLYTTSHAGDLVYLADQHWPVPLHLFTSGVSAVLVQSFLVVRYWRLCVSPFLPPDLFQEYQSSTRNILVTLINFLLIIVTFGGSFACGMTIAMFPAFKQRNKVAIPVSILLVGEAVADLSIAAALLWQLRKARNLAGTRSVLNRLVALTIQTGTATATIAVAALIAFLLDPESNVSVGIGYTLGRMYVISMLANLNVRISGRSAFVASGSVSFPNGPGIITTPSIFTDDFSRSHFRRTIGPSPFNLGRRQELVPVVLFVACEDTDKLLELLVDTFYLAVGIHWKSV
ncbi:hypothetical protein DFH08DRAFT_1019835 [Mycena albidolilacea]|uniref:DUF6534 domain-containing protein n=1 Tax=Mycena albidolilacea TaxID=1033008 RepID=A0AAD6ZQ45_9AGAR|nr:hypothetical protein DFH08DRAFT_1019835 [Mycena albidolilacea]